MIGIKISIAKGAIVISEQIEELKNKGVFKIRVNNLTLISFLSKFRFSFTRNYSTYT